MTFCAVVLLLSFRRKKQIEKDGIETGGVISRIVDEGGEDEISLRYYARYRTGDGEEVEGIVLNPSSGLTEGQRVRIKYHPRHQTNAIIISYRGPAEIQAP